MRRALPALAPARIADRVFPAAVGIARALRTAAGLGVALLVAVALVARQALDAVSPGRVASPRVAIAVGIARARRGAVLGGPVAHLARAAAATRRGAFDALAPGEITYRVARSAIADSHTLDAKRGCRLADVVAAAGGKAAVEVGGARRGDGSSLVGEVRRQ